MLVCFLRFGCIHVSRQEDYDWDFARPYASRRHNYDVMILSYIALARFSVVAHETFDQELVNTKVFLKRARL